jgi:ABC-2 type transport system permease protein
MIKKLRKALLPILVFVPIDIRRLFRDKVAIFFVFIFPLIFLGVFGTIFGGNDNVSFKVAVINQSNSEFAGTFVQQAKDSEVLDVDEEATTMDQAREKMNRSEISATLVLPEDFGQVSNNEYPSGQVTVLYDQNNEQAGQTLQAVLESMFDEINSQYVQNETPFSVKTESTATKGLTRFDYTFAGLLGFTLLSLGVFGPTTTFPRLKEKGVLRRYHTTTLKVWQYFTGNVISNAFVGILSVVVMFLTAIIFFDLSMRGDYLSFLAVVILGATLLFGIGLAVGGWAKNENQAAPLAQLVTFPMMFLSGVFFPVFLMPEWLQSVTKFIPLTPIIDSIRYVVTEGKTLFDLGPQLLVIGVWIIVIYIIAFRSFRWE